MKESVKFYLVVDFLDLQKSTICRSMIDVASVVGMHRNSILPDKDKIYNHFYVKPVDVKKKISNAKGNPENFKKDLF
jgi:hypothetical protein